MKVLSIDGGGIRGLIPALVLAEIERRTGRPTAELFDLIAGTSTGGILACGLTRPGPDGKPLHSAEELAELYRTEGPKIFDRSLLKKITSVGGLIDERYDDDALNAALATYLGDARLKDAVTDVFITAYDIKDRFAFFFRSSRARTDDTYDFAMAEAARATAAAPTYFEPVEVTDAAGARTYPLIDGGVYAINPAMCAYAEVVGTGADISVIAALGTGAQTKAYDVRRRQGLGPARVGPAGARHGLRRRRRHRRLRGRDAQPRPLPALPGRAALRLRRPRRRQRGQPAPPRRGRRAPDRRAERRRSRRSARRSRASADLHWKSDARAPFRQVHVPEGRPGLAPPGRGAPRRRQARVPRRLRGLRRRAAAAGVLDGRHARRLRPDAARRRRRTWSEFTSSTWCFPRVA